MRVIGPFLLLFLASPSHATQLHLTPPPPRPLSTTVVDLLSSSTNHTLLIKALQRTRLIPVLNRLNGSTFFAPTDEAIESAAANEKLHMTARATKPWTGREDDDENAPIWNYAISEDGNMFEGEGDSGKTKRDNLQLALRDTLLYHVLNYSLPLTTTLNSSAFSFLPPNIPTLQESLYHPALSSYNKSFPGPPSLPGSPPDDPDPDGPKAGEGLLRGEGQRVRVVKRAFSVDDGPVEEIWVGGDWQGKGGLRVVNGSFQQADNGVLLGLEGVLDRPTNIAKLIRAHPNLSTLASLMPVSLLDYISTASHLTIFAPTNDAWNSLSDLEMKYLRSGFAEIDLTEIFGDAASSDGAGNGKVGYLEKLVGANGTRTTLIKTFFGSTLDVRPAADESGSATVNGSQIITADILAKNGVLHIVPNLLLPQNSLSLTAEKYLIALNATKFVSLLRSVNLSHYVQVPSGQPSFVPTGAAVESYTILAVKNDVIDAGEVEATDLTISKSIPAPGTPELKDLLTYHILGGSWTTKDLVDGMLVGTELRGENLKGARQRLAVSVQVAEEMRGLGWMGRGKERGDGVVAFGGASVVADPVVVGNSIIYLISSILEPPSSLVTTAVSDLRLSTFIASVYAASLDKALTRAPAVTYLVPSNNAFTSLGLVMSYLLLPAARSELRSVIRYHAIDEVVYMDDFPVGTGSVRYPTLLDGAEIYVERTSYNSTPAIHGPTVGGIPANGETRDGRVIEGDVLISTGVLHVIDQVELPPDLNIGIGKLFKGAKASTMADLIRAANMSWVLQGKPPPPQFEFGISGLNKGGKKHKRKDGGKGAPRALGSNRAYTILCPTDKALSRLNLTYYLSDPVALTDLVKLHIIPTNAFAPLSSDGRPLTLEDEITYPTLLDKQEGGGSDYGSVAFRRWGEDEWLVGIKSARGTNGESDSARVVAYGRATPSFLAEGDETRLASAGGVLTIDSVLIPFHPSWFRRWGWMVVVGLLGLAVVILVGLLVVKLWRGKKVEYERLEGEED